jgi:hypothetical protein
MFKIIVTKDPSKTKLFETEQEAIAYVKRQKKAKGYFTMEEIKHEEPKTKEKVRCEKKPSWNEHKGTIDFTGAVQVTRENVKEFYKKTGCIRVTDSAGQTLHIGRTTNMGKVFSNYVNCAKYNQSYDFNLMKGDKLFFKESDINY